MTNLLPEKHLWISLLFSVAFLAGPITAQATGAFCGCSTSRLNDRIVGGQIAEPNSLPYQVYFSVGCGGTILNKRFVLTAGHCVDGLTTASKLRRVRIYAGLVDINNLQAPGVQTRSVKKVFMHPGYRKNSASLKYDFAILELSTDLVMSEKVQRACLPETDVVDNEILYVSGWGTTSFGGSQSDTLRYVDQKVIPNQVCLTQTDNANLHFQSQFCAGYLEGGKDSCQGDSGGPIIRIKSNDEVELMGVVSWGNGCAAPRNPGVYGRVFAVKNWINPIIRNVTC